MGNRILGRAKKIVTSKAAKIVGGVVLGLGTLAGAGLIIREKFFKDDVDSISDENIEYAEDQLDELEDVVNE